ncbi:MAG: transaldolase family protein [Minisyncoccia bacterium]
MKIFIDSANLADIEESLRRGFAHGITTNPSLLAKEPKGSFNSHVLKIIKLIKKYKPGTHLSIEVFSKNPEEIYKQACDFVKRFNYSHLSIKVQVGWDELEVIKKLSDKRISVNCTACMNTTQAVMAAKAGAKYVSLFWGRIKDGGIDTAFEKVRSEMIEKSVIDKNDFNPAFVVKSVRQILDDQNIKSEIIVGSIRGVTDIRDAALSGAHIVTIPPKFFPQMMNHFKTDQVVEQFLSDFDHWLS